MIKDEKKTSVGSISEEKKSININVLIVIIVGFIGIMMAGGSVYGFIKGIGDVTVLTTIVSSVITGLLGIVVGKAMD